MMQRWMTFIFFLAVILTACAEEQPQQSTEPVANQPSPVPTTLHVWVEDSVILPALEAATQTFHETYPQFTVILTPLVTTNFPLDLQQQILNGAAVDMLIIDNTQLANLIDMGIVQSISITEVFDDATFDRSLLLQQEGQTYGIPIAYTSPLIYTNPELVDVPIDQFGLLLNYSTLVQTDFMVTSGWLTRDFGTPILDGDNNFTFSRIALIEYFERLASLQDNERIQLSNDPTPFLEEEVAIYIGNPIQPSFDVETYMLQPHPDEPNYGLHRIIAGTITINATTQSAVAAQYWLAFLQSYDLESPYQDISQATNIEFLPPITSLYEEALPTYNTAIGAVLSGVLSPEEAADAILGE